MEFRTCEEYVLSLLKEAEDKNASLQEKLNKSVEMYNNSQTEKTELETVMQMKINRLERTIKAFLHKAKLGKEGYIAIETTYSFEHNFDDELIREAVNNYKTEVGKIEDTESTEDEE